MPTFINTVQNCNSFVKYLHFMCAKHLKSTVDEELCMRIVSFEIDYQIAIHLYQNMVDELDEAMQSKALCIFSRNCLTLE